MSDRPVLIVENSADDEMLILRAFEKYNVTNPRAVVRDGAEALDYLFRTGAYEDRPPVDPIVVILDLNLPKIGGLDVLARLRGDQRTGLLPIVVLTSSDDEDDIVRSYQLGANSYVRKPIDFSRFSEAVGWMGVYWTAHNEPVPQAA